MEVSILLLMMKKVLNKLLVLMDLFLLLFKLLMGLKIIEVVFILVMFVKMDLVMLIMLLLLLVMEIKMDLIIILLRTLGVDLGEIKDILKFKEVIICVVWLNVILFQILDRSKMNIYYKKKRFNYNFIY